MHFPKADFLVSLMIALAISHLDEQTARAQASAEGWQVFEECPVFVESEVEVPALEGGVLETVDVEKNQAVEEGTVVASLDTELPKLQLHIADVQYRAAQKQMHLDSAILASEASLKILETELANKRKAGTSISVVEMGRAEQSVIQAKQALMEAKQDKLRAEAEALLKKATFDAAAIRLKHCQVKTRLKGIVSEVLREAGESVEAGQPICKVQNLDHLIVDLLLPECGVNRTKLIGSPVRVESLAHDGKPTLLSGSIVSYDPEVSSQELIRVHARISNVQKDGHWLLLPGESVKMHVSAVGLDQDYLSATTNPGSPRYISTP